MAVYCIQSQKVDDYSQRWMEHDHGSETAGCTCPVVGSLLVAGLVRQIAPCLHLASDPMYYHLDHLDIQAS
jgi:hypothetical protein